MGNSRMVIFKISFLPQTAKTARRSVKPRNTLENIITTFIMNKRMKINPTQWTVMLDFLEEHPCLITHKFASSNGRQDYNVLWAQLTTKLNAMGLGCKTVEKWQRSLTDWKQKVKTKAQALRQECQATGGGEGQIPPLNNNEVRLINLMGWSAIKGNENIELGVASDTSGSTAVLAHPPKFVKLPENLILTPLLTSDANADVKPLSTLPQQMIIENAGPSTPPHTSTTPSRSTVKRKRTADTKEDGLEQMHNDLMTVLHSINDNISRLADTATVLVHYLTELKKP